MVSTSEGDTETDTVSAAASAAGGAVSSSGIRVPSSSATALTIERLGFRRNFNADEMRETAQFLNWGWNLTRASCR